VSLSACSEKDPRATFEKVGNGTPEILECSLSGTWSRCDTDGFSSQLITLSLGGSTINESIDAFNSNASCQGTPDDQYLLQGSLQMGEYGASESIEGATDVDIAFDEDIGCGVGSTVYTALKFVDSCSEFYPSNSQPGCESSSRGSAIDENSPFIKQ